MARGNRLGGAIRGGFPRSPRPAAEQGEPPVAQRQHEERLDHGLMQPHRQIADDVGHADEGSALAPLGGSTPGEQQPTDDHPHAAERRHRTQPMRRAQRHCIERRREQNRAAQQ